MPAKGYVSNLMGGLLSGFYGTPNPAAPSVLENLADAQTYNKARNYGEMLMAASIAAPFLAQGAMGGARRLDRAMNAPQFQAGFNRFMDNNPRLAEGLTALQSPSQIFIGKNSKLWNADNESLFRRLEKEGKSREDIFKQTLTMRLPDGSLRQEVPDLLPDGQPWRANPRRLLQADGAYDNAYANAYREKFGREYDPARKEDLSVRDAKDLNDAGTQALREARSAKYFLQHDALNRGYPGLMDVQVVGNEKLLPMGGSFDPYRKELTVGVRGLTDEAVGNDFINPNLMRALNDTALHEAQHFAQSADKTARGANPEDVSSAVAMAFREEAQNAPDRLEKLLGEFERGKRVSKAQKTYRNYQAASKMHFDGRATEARILALPGGKKALEDAATLYPDDKARQLKRASAALSRKFRADLEKTPGWLTNVVFRKAVEAAPKNFSRIMAAREKDAMSIPGMAKLIDINKRFNRIDRLPKLAKYQNSYGEVEARLAGHRRNYTDEQRRNSFPLSREQLEASTRPVMGDKYLNLLRDDLFWFLKPD